MVRYPKRRLTVELCVSVVGLAALAWAVRADTPWFERHVLETYCVTGPGDERIVLGARLVGAGLGALLLIVVRPILGRRAAGLPIGELVVRVASVLLAAVAALGVTEVWLRSRDPHPPSAPAWEEPRLRLDGRGWHYLPNQTRVFPKYGRVVDYAIDGEGNRARRQQDVVDRARPTLLLAGESMAYGWNVPYDESLQGLLERETGLQVVNLSAPGYSTEQEYVRIADALPRFAKPVAVVLLLVNTQISRNAHTHRPHLEIAGDGTPVFAPAAGGLPGLRVVQLLTERLYHPERAVQITAAILRAADRAIRERGARPIFLVTNFGPTCAREPELLHELFEQQRLPFVRVAIAEEDWLAANDRHAGPSGMRKLADAVERALAGP
ncbi:MAG TPA: hypothetical protein VKE22_30195 [Haliangiales bacterium]|nr:hypothetical protein [Haliangiales bacterium]